MSFGIAPGLDAITSQSLSGEERRLRAHRDYSQCYAAWIVSLKQQADGGNQSATFELSALKGASESSGINLLVPQRYDRPARRNIGEDAEDFSDPADLAVDFSDPREPIVDFDTVNNSELKHFCEHFGAALVWATTKSKTGAQPDLMQMGARWIAIFIVMRPQLVGEMNLRLPTKMISNLRQSLSGRDPLETGKFFRKPMALVRKCTSLLQLGKRGYSAIYILRGDLINSATCAAIGALDNKSRQAANKPIQEFRDTFGGIKSLPMRGKETRQRCKKAQEKN